MIEFEHSPLGGSAAKRFLTCGSSFLLQRILMLHGEYEEPATSPQAEKGIAAHLLAAECLIEQAEPFEYIGETIGRFTVCAEDLDPDAVAVYVNYCNGIREKGGPGSLTVVEATYHLRDIHPLYKGTVDFGHYRPYGHVEPGVWMIDYKNGEGVGVAAFQNPQLLYYGGLFMQANADLRKLPNDFPVYLGIVQPNYYGMFDEPEVWITDVATVKDFTKKSLLPAMARLVDDKRIMLPQDEFVPGDHCHFCPVMLDCPRLRESFDIFANGDEFVMMLSDKEISDLYPRIQEARWYGNEVEKVAFARKMGKRDIPTAKLVEKQSRRVFKPGAEMAALAKFGDGAYAPRKAKSPAQLEKHSSDAKAFVLEWAFKPQSDRYTVAPLSDRRAEAIPEGNAEIFKHFATPETPIEDLGW